jgi:Protein of unknown function (DUF1559)
MRELLVRYLLGELNTQEQEQLEAQLRDSPEMRRELEYLRACLTGGEDETSDRVAATDTPRGLAERTLDRVCGEAPCEEVARCPDEVAAAYDPPVGTPSWSLADLTVAGGVFLAISMLFLPALRQSRDAARRNGCSNNLRQLGAMLISYSETKGHFFPTPTRQENAGIFAVYLLEEGYAGSDELTRLLMCRSSPMADQQVTIYVPRMWELEAASAKERCQLKHSMSPCYAYLLGFVDGDRQCSVHNDHSCRKAVLADASSAKFDNLVSENHGGCGGNVLYQDGHVNFERQSTLRNEQLDVIYLNDAGKQEAGVNRNDTVLGPSAVTPRGAEADRQK